MGRTTPCRPRTGPARREICKPCAQLLLVERDILNQALEREEDKITDQQDCKAGDDRDRADGGALRETPRPECLRRGIRGMARISDTTMIVTIYEID
jgi:hypothetical protein